VISTVLRGQYYGIKCSIKEARDASEQYEIARTLPTTYIDGKYIDEQSRIIPGVQAAFRFEGASRSHCP
jgi:hypothetical protein